MRYYESVVGLIGNTPLVRLRRVTAGIPARVTGFTGRRTRGRG